ncbi:GNAT family N-acetyltransferase [Embleya sp. NPDC056575]|uniref:GNAT family N-acetyltransferase n=1 Tax=unclassified Embleya TaxID=2699296 RepID=UPI0036899E7A
MPTTYLTPLTDPKRSPSAHRLAWLAADAHGIPRGSAFLRLFDKPGQDHLAELEVHVHPAERRDGVGTALLHAAVEAAREAGRRSLLAQAKADSPGAAFLSERGFRDVLTLIYTRLPLTDHEPGDAAWAAIADRDHPGYRLHSWDGTVADALAETFAASRRAMDDMPMGETDYGTVVWDVERLRAAAQAIADRGELLHTVVAIDTADDTIAGFTELVVPGDGKGDGQHYSTGVLPEHRGHGLGLWMKAEAIRQARERHPNLTALLTDTAEANHAMRAINDTLGYRPTHRSTEYQLDLPVGRSR